jgi:hypothetical protein
MLDPDTNHGCSYCSILFFTSHYSSHHRYMYYAILSLKGHCENSITIGLCFQFLLDFKKNLR